MKLEERTFGTPYISAIEMLVIIIIIIIIIITV